MIERLADELIQLGRYVAGFERNTVCCGTVTISQCIALQQLAREPTDMSRLAEFSGVSVSAMTRLVDSLERSGWIARRRARDDRRKVIVELTDEGRVRAQQLREATLAGVRQVLSHVPAEKHAQVLESLELARKAMEAADEVTCCKS